MACWKYILALAFCMALFCGCSGDDGVTTTQDMIPPEVAITSSESSQELSSSVLDVVAGFPVAFTEVDPINTDYEDHEGDDAGWVELYNSSDTVVNLSGFSLTDSEEEPQKWTFGNAAMAPHSFMLVFLSGKNYGDFVQPHDTTDMIGDGCWTWTDSQNDPPGKSYAEPLAGNSKNCYTAADGSNRIGAIMKYEKGDELDWTSISVFVGTGSSNKTDVADLTLANELLLSGFITKGRKVSIRLAQPDVDDWNGYEIIFEGTGDSNTTYRSILPGGTTFPDLANIYGTRFSPESNEYGEVTMDIRKYVVRNRGHEPHANFKAKKEGGSLYLVNSQNQVLDKVTYPAMEVGKTWSLGNSSLGSTVWGYAEASPYGYTVSAVNETKSLAPSAELPLSGFYSEPFAVAFDASKYVRCGYDGFAPTAESPLVTELTISKTEVLRCASFVPGTEPSAIENRTYVFENQPTLASVFITGDPNSFFDADTGIYELGPNAQSEYPYFGANFWQDREIPVHLEFLEPSVNSPAFSKDAGYQIFGNYSRANDKKSIAIIFREKYGDKRLEYPIYPEYPSLREFKSIVFRVGNFGMNYIQDALASSLSDGLDVDYQHNRPVIIFYNGEYYGIYGMREKANEYYFETKYGYDAEQIDLLKADNAVTSGSASDYISLMDWIENHDMTSDENLDYVKSQIDVDNYINYMQTEIFVDNRDWPGNNLKKWRCNSPSTPWKWFLYDLDFGFDNGFSEYTNNFFEFMLDSTASGWPNGTEYTILMRNLFKNQSFEQRFVNRFVATLSMNFSEENVLARINSMMSEITSEISRDQKRWGLSSSRMQSNLNTMKAFAANRGETILQEMREYFGLGESAPITLSTSGPGTILVHDLPLSSLPMTLGFFKDYPVVLSAQGTSGGIFTGWSDGETDPVRTVKPGEISELKALFK